MRRWRIGAAVLAAVLLVGTAINYARAQTRTGTTEQHPLDGA